MINMQFNKLKLQKEIEKLKTKKGIHTSLISMYIPATKSVNDVLNHIKNEITESQNIKDKVNRQNVITNLVSIQN